MRYLWVVFYWDVAFGDLPVHCEMNSVAGEWKFWTTKPNDSTQVPSLPLAMDGTSFCLGSAGKPTMSSDLMAKGRFSPEASSAFTDSFTVGLSMTQMVHARGNSDDYDRHELVARTGAQVGKWSMIFDEGFEVRIGNRSYLAISRYTCASDTPDAWCKTDKDAHENSDGSVSGWQPVCSETFIGWYHEIDSVSQEVTGLGCWFGKRTPGETPAYLLKPVEVSFAQENRLRRLHNTLERDSVKNACDIDEGVEDMNVDSLPTNFSWRDQYKSFEWETPITIQVCQSQVHVVNIF